MARRATRVRRGAAAWQAVVDRQAASGVSRKVFCEREGIPRSSFETWRGRLAARAAEARFVALAPAPAEGNRSTSGVMDFGRGPRRSGGGSGRKLG